MQPVFLFWAHSLLQWLVSIIQMTLPLLQNGCQYIIIHRFTREIATVIAAFILLALVNFFLNRQSRISCPQTINKGLKYVQKINHSSKSNDFSHSKTATAQYWSGNTRFGFHLLFTLLENRNDENKSNQNIIISPLGITNIFSLPYAAAPQGSQTGKEIANTLYYPIKTVADPSNYHNVLLIKVTNLPILITIVSMTILTKMQTKKRIQERIAKKLHQIRNVTKSCWKWQIECIIQTI